MEKTELTLVQPVKNPELYFKILVQFFILLILTLLKKKQNWHR